VRLRNRGEAAPADVVSRAALARGEKTLAHARSTDGTWLLGTRVQLVVVPPSSADVDRLPWERVEGANWDKDESLLRVTGVGEFGQPRPSYSFAMDDPALLLQLLRERVTASIVLQRRVPVRGDLGLTVIGRRSPVGGPVQWMHAYDPGLDPLDPEVVVVADLALSQAQSEVGELAG
jgi:hypothetical protein